MNFPKSEKKKMIKRMSLLLGKHVTWAHCVALDDFHNVTRTKSQGVRKLPGEDTTVAVTHVGKPARALGWGSPWSPSKCSDVVV